MDRERPIVPNGNHVCPLRRVVSRRNGLLTLGEAGGVVSTSLLIPVEVYEIIDHVSGVRVGALLLNLGIVGYLISQLKHHRLRKRAA